MVEEIKSYRTKDGKIFSTREEAEYHESLEEFLFDLNEINNMDCIRPFIIVDNETVKESIKDGSFNLILTELNRIYTKYFKK